MDDRNCKPITDSNIDPQTDAARKATHLVARYLNARFVADPSIVTRQIGEEMILVPIRRHAGEPANIFTLDDVGVEIWRRLSQDKPLRDIADEIAEIYDVTLEQARQDLVELVQQLEAINAVRIKEE